MTHHISPRLNINGTSLRDLIDPRIAASRYLQQAIDSLCNAMPNGRDYLGDIDACVADRVEMYRRIGLLAEMQDDLRDEGLVIQRQARN
jgi:hypothetical protein